MVSVRGAAVSTGRGLMSLNDRQQASSQDLGPQSCKRVLLLPVSSRKHPPSRERSRPTDAPLPNKSTVPEPAPSRDPQPSSTPGGPLTDPPRGAGPRHAPLPLGPSPRCCPPPAAAWDPLPRPRVLPPVCLPRHRVSIRRPSAPLPWKLCSSLSSPKPLFSKKARTCSGPQVR